MTDPEAARSFLRSEVEHLETFDFVAVGPANDALHAVEVTRNEAGGLEVRVPGRPRFLPELEVAVRSKLRERGFASEDPADRGKPWVRPVDDAASAVEIAQRLITEVYGEKTDAPLDVAHGSHRAEYEVRKKLAQVRERLAEALSRIAEHPAQQDADGDFVLPVGNVQVGVAPRAAPNGPVVVRIFAVTNTNVNVTPELGIFLARLNFGLMFGRFALDTENRSIWFDETLLGDQFREEELRFTIHVVATTADQWDDRLKQMFGGETWQEVQRRLPSQDAPRAKPGEGGYL